MSERNKIEIKIGNVAIGANHLIAIQTMCQTKTSNIDACINEINYLARCGADIVRIAITDIDDATAIKEIKKRTNVPLVADIHYDYSLALLAVKYGIDKLRINPGNIGKKEHLQAIADICLINDIPVRIGINMGSLDPCLMKEYGRSAEALFLSAKKSVEIMEGFGLKKIVLSLKASDIKTTVKANQMANAYFKYPLHLGITEAGDVITGTVKSTIGISQLLEENIGDTIRVSLAGTPETEVRIAREILASLNLIARPALIACPMCGRTKWKMQPVVDKIGAYLNTLPNIKIKVAVMGCAVNGPGEARDADIGVAGGINEVILFKKGITIRKIKEENVISELIKEINELITSKRL